MTTGGIAATYAPTYSTSPSPSAPIASAVDMLGPKTAGSSSSSCGGTNMTLTCVSIAVFGMTPPRSVPRRRQSTRALARPSTVVVARFRADGRAASNPVRDDRRRRADRLLRARLRPAARARGRVGDPSPAELGGQRLQNLL